MEALRLLEVGHGWTVGLELSVLCMTMHLTYKIFNNQPQENQYLLDSHR